jgi:DNA invertase Pin-like site-specific DNA recombinase
MVGASAGKPDDSSSWRWINPHPNKLTIHILAAVAEHERDAISERGKAALAAAKARGKRLGTPDPGGAVNPMRAAPRRRQAICGQCVLAEIRAAAGDTGLNIAGQLNVG